MVKIKSKSLLLVITLISIVVFNINERMIYLILSISIFNNKKFNLNSTCLKQLQEKLQNITYIIIDEKNMIGHYMLILIDMRLRQAFSKNNNKAFKGQSINMFKDFR